MQPTQPRLPSARNTSMQSDVDLPTHVVCSIIPHGATATTCTALSENREFSFQNLLAPDGGVIACCVDAPDEQPGGCREIKTWD